MNTTSQTIQHPGRLSAFRWIASGSAMGALVSIAVIALAIVGLAGAYSPTMAAIATIVTGGAILIEGGTLQAGAFKGLGDNESHQVDLTRFPTAEALGGVAGIVLGILALLGVSAQTLVSVAVLAFGATLLLNGAAMAERTWFAGPADGKALLGLSVAVLGLLAVIGISDLTLALVGLLILGVAGMFCGATRPLTASQEMSK